MTNPILTLDQAAAHVGLTPDALLLSFYRGLPPGNLGFKETPSGPLVFKRADLLPPPRRAKFIAGIADELALHCPECDFVAKSKGGLTTHRRKHG